MIFRFPFRWGPQAPTTPVVPTVTPLWTRLTPSGQNWQVEIGLLVPRFERVVTLGDTGPQFQKVTDVVS